MSASLLGLPGELRNAIYAFYIASKPHPEALILILHGSEPAQLATPPLSQVCHQIRSELLPLWKTVDIFQTTRLRVVIENLDVTPLLALLSTHSQRGCHRITDVKLILRFTNAVLIARHGKTAARVWPKVDLTRLSGLYHQVWSWTTGSRTWWPPRIRCSAELDWIGLGGDSKGGRHASLCRRMDFDATANSLAKIAQRAEEVVRQGPAGKRVGERAFRTWWRLELFDWAAAIRH